MEPEFNDWWASLKHGGLLIAPSRLVEYFPPQPDPMPAHLAERLRRDVTRLDVGTSEAERALIDTVLEGVCGLNGGWKRGADVDGKWSHRALTGEIVKPRRTWEGSNGAFLPVFFDPETRLGVGRGKRSVARVVEWLRKLNQHLALVTNARQWRLLYAGLNHEAWAEWDIDLWFQEGQPGLQVAALRCLLTPQALTPPKQGEPCPLLGAILDTRRGQAELSAELGERVRRAVELLIRSHGTEIHKLGPEVKPRDVYLAATRVIMRMVVILFAEARDLLPRSNPQYHDSYGLQGLRETLERVGGGGASERLRERASAWPRILGLFRLVHQGSPHERLPIVRYGGGMFAAGDPAATDPVGRALAVFEYSEHSPSDAVVCEILHLLCRSRVKVRQGKGASWIEVPVDFSDLSSEYIGILYEGLLDYELRRVEGTDPIIFLTIGDEPALPLSRLESMDESALSALVEKLKAKRSKATQEEESEKEGEDENEEAEESDSQTEPPPVEPTEEHLDDAHLKTRERAQAWARKAVLAGKLVAKPRSKKPEAQREHKVAIDLRAGTLIGHVVLPGEWYLVQWGGTRKGAGTFYTRPGLAIPTAQSTLRPLAYTPPERSGIPDEDASASEWTPKKPEEILALKVCDPAVGSGSFLIAALRFLTDALFVSLHHHARIRAQASSTMVTLAEGKPTQGLLVEESLPCRPDADEFEAILRARLKRYVVERCLYGVDMDPLAVELAKLSLWVETMDRSLPFEFLEDKLKSGNALVGCWFDRFRDYPVMAWEREGGDKSHSNGVHFAKEVRTKAIAQFRQKTLKSALRTWLEGLGPQKQFDFVVEGKAPETLYDEVVELFGQMNRIPIHEPDRRAEFYRTKVSANPQLLRLKSAFDTWCAIWFWPADSLAIAPLPADHLKPSPEVGEVVATLKDRHRFFHWELEFPSVFTKAGSGFDAVLGNPPWETQKPSSKEYFSNHDPLYRTYGKVKAVEKQSEHFRLSAEEEREWLEYNERFKALVNWINHVGSPFGDGADDGKPFTLGRDSAYLFEIWKSKRSRRTGYTDPEHPYRHQGTADVNTYKLFIEQARSLLRDGGQLGFIVPSGVYTDKGTTDIRVLLLTRCRWRWLFGFENRNKIFDIDSRFKFGPIIVQKGGVTDFVRSAFMRRDLRDWEEPQSYALAYPRERVEQFSPHSKAFLELSSQRDLDVLSRLYEHGTLLDNKGSSSWSVTCSRELHMTDDAGRFKPLAHFEDSGFTVSEYGPWTAATGERAFPLLQGVMLHHFTCWAKNWVRGSGVRARWEPTEMGQPSKRPQYMLHESEYQTMPAAQRGLKIAYSRIRRTTDTRTWIGTITYGFPAGDSIFLLYPQDQQNAALFDLCGYLNSFVYDWQLRSRMGGTNVSWFFLAETAVPSPATSALVALGDACVRLSAHSVADATLWMVYLAHRKALRTRSWHSLRAVTPMERLRLRVISDALSAEIAGLTIDDFAWILRDCDHPVAALSRRDFTDGLDPRGFWRVDKEKAPECRHSVLALVAFHCLKDIGVEAFLALNNGDGWCLPDVIRLADYGLGHDGRAEKEQPVCIELGERFLPWQLDQPTEESWHECSRHARMLLGTEGYARLEAELRGRITSPPTVTKPANEKVGQGLLFGKSLGSSDKKRD